MNGDSAGSQCGLTSLLPMSCRGRAAAFARDLHSRLRNLGTNGDENGESSWLNNSQRSSSSTQRDHDTFYDFELVCESPCSPVDEYDPAFLQRSPVDIKEPPFNDVPEPDCKELTTLKLQQPDKTKNGFRFSTAFYTEYSPVKLQPAPRENGHAEKKLYSPITFEGCARQNSHDEVDYSIARSSPTLDIDQFSLPTHLISNIDSDSEFESAKSDPSESNCEETDQESKDDTTDNTEKLSITEFEIVLKDDNADISTETTNTIENVNDTLQNLNEPLEIVTSEVVENEKEASPALEIEPSLLTVEIKDEDEDDRPQRVRRCSSLKTGKTPPGTPGRKKIVRFADVLGLDLADVKTFMDEIPVIPKSAYDDLTGCDFQNSPPTRTPPRLGSLTLVPLFQLPKDVADKLEKQNVCLESAKVCDGVHVTICGSVRVRNLDFNKTVHVRYTMNSWKTYTDLQTVYVQGSCDGFSDRFQFILYAPCISTGQRLELAVRFQCKGQQFWDNNNGVNYCFDCLALGATLPAPTISSPLHPTLDWHPSFY